MTKPYITLLFFLVFYATGFSQEEVLPLWPENIPNSRASPEKEVVEDTDIIRISKVQQPNIKVYLPSKKNATGQAMLICPGGGYHHLAYDWEGTDIAKFLNSKGIAGIVLKYRLPNSQSVKVSYEAPLQDAQRAIRIIRSRANTWNIDPHKIGVIGFSAGGHLAATLGTHFNNKNSFEEDTIDLLSARPNFMALVYPVITMKGEYAEQGSKTGLLGKNPDPKLINKFSNELQVKADTPPTFIVHATDDSGVPVENSLMFYKALKDKNIPAEIHIYPKGGHGFGLALGRGYLQSWTDRLYDWLVAMNENKQQ